MRFHRSKLYASVIPILGLALFVGFAGALLGIGGGFIMVPALLYVFRVPTAVVVGTSQFQILCTTLVALILHAVANQAVDIVLAILLILGGVFGAQFGARAGRNLRAELFRFLLAILLLAVGLRFALELIVRPNEPFSITVQETRHVRTESSSLLRSPRSALAAASAAETLITSLSNHRVLINSNYTGHVDRGLRRHRARCPDRLPRHGLRRRRHRARPAAVPGRAREGAARSRLDQSGAAEVPRRAGLSRRPLLPTHRRDHERPAAARQKIGLEAIVNAPDFTNDRDGADEPFREALLRLKKREGLYLEDERGVAFLTPTIFRAAIPLPATAPPGNYDVEVTLLRRHGHPGPDLDALRAGQDRLRAAGRRGRARLVRLYGALTAALALFFGWLASVIFRRD